MPWGFLAPLEVYNWAKKKAHGSLAGYRTPRSEATVSVWQGMASTQVSWLHTANGTVDNQGSADDKLST
jgi:hypothetical protein